MLVLFETSMVINLNMPISELMLTLPPDTKSLIRSIEKTNRKIINTELSLVFNKTCIQENLLPAYTNIFILVNLGRMFSFKQVLLNKITQIF